MIRLNSERTVQQAIRAGAIASALMLLTTIHHFYGAAIYSTPWRRHVAIPSLLTILIIAGALLVFYRSPRTRGGLIALWTSVAVIALFPVATIGLYEGLYNHLLKDLLYFGGAPHTLLTRLFPPPTYEMPNDLFFEVTGVLQAFVGWFVARDTYRLARSAMDRRLASRGTMEPAACPVPR